MKKVKNYFKWLFTRWYLYVLAFVFLLNFGVYNKFYGLADMLGVFVGNLIAAAIIITIIYFVIKLIKKVIKK